MAATVHLSGFGLAMQNRTLDTSRSKSSPNLMSWMLCRLEMLKHPQLCFICPGSTLPFWTLLMIPPTTLKVSLTVPMVEDSNELDVALVP